MSLGRYKAQFLWSLLHGVETRFATRNKCIASSNKCLTSSNKKQVGARMLLEAKGIATRKHSLVPLLSGSQGCMRCETGFGGTEASGIP